jgi:hypothetical protein
MASDWRVIIHGWGSCSSASKSYTGFHQVRTTFHREDL